MTSDGLRIVSASGAHTLRAFDLETGEEHLAVQESSRSIISLALTPDGQTALWGCHGRGVNLRDLRTGASRGRLDCKDVRVVAASPDGRLALTGGDRKVRQWDLATGAEGRALSGHLSQVSRIVVLPDSRRAVSTGGDSAIKLHDLVKGKATTLTKTYVTGLAAAPDGQRLAWTTWNGEITVWDLSAGRIAAQGRHRSAEQIAFTPDSARLVVAGEGLAVLDAAALSPIREMPAWAGDARARHLALTPDGARAALAVASPRWLGGGASVEVWDLERGERIGAARGHATQVEAAVIDAGGAALSVCDDNTLRRWAPGDGEGVVLARGVCGRALALTPDGRTAVVATEERDALLVLDAASGKERARIAVPAARLDGGLIVSPDGALVYHAAGAAVASHRLDGGGAGPHFKGHRFLVIAMALSRDGATLLTSSQDGTARLWSTADGRCLHVLADPSGSFVSAAALHPGGGIAASASVGQVHLWDTATGAKRGTLRALRGDASGLAFTPDGRFLIAAAKDGYDDGGLRIWDWALGAEIETLDFSSAADWATCLALSPDGRTAVVGSGRGVLYRFAL